MRDPSRKGDLKCDVYRGRSVSVGLRSTLTNLRYFTRVRPLFLVLSEKVDRN